MQLFHINFFQLSYLAKTPFVLTSALLLPLIFIHLYDILTKRKSRNKYWFYLLLFSFFVNLFSIFFANTKNGFIIFCVVLFEFFIFIFLKSRFYLFSLKNIFLILIIFLSFLFTAAHHIQKNPAWLKILNEVKLGIDIDHNFYWMDPINFELPLDESGVHVNGSAYERSAWFVAGIKLIPYSPQGYGLLTHSFGRLAKNKWPDFRSRS